MLNAWLNSRRYGASMGGGGSGESQPAWEAGKIKKKQTAARQQATLEQGPASSATGASRGLGEQTGQLELIQHINKFILTYSNLHSVPGTSGTQDYARG